MVCKPQTKFAFSLIFCYNLHDISAEFPMWIWGRLMNYNKLWKLLIDKKLRKKDLREMAGLSTNVIAKMGKGGDVSTQVLRKICEALDCKIEDIVELD